MPTVLMINGVPFKCDCGCISMKKAPVPEGERDGEYFECQCCGSVYEKT